MVSREDSQHTRLVGTCVCLIILIRLVKDIIVNNVHIHIYKFS